MKKSLLLFLILLGACQKKGMDSAFMFTKSGELKDKIALTMMIDSSAQNHKWDVCAEITDYLEKDLARKDTLYVIPVKNKVELSSENNPFSKNLSWLDSNFPNTRFVAFTELLKYEEVHNFDPNLGYNIDLSARIRVFEKTDMGFKIVLQEILQESYMIPSVFSKILNLQSSYNSPGYELSPVGVAHQDFSKLIAKRIRNYTKR